MSIEDPSAVEAEHSTSVQKSAPNPEDRVRVLFAIDSRFPGPGGAEIQSLKLANALRDRGVDVDFVVPHLIKPSPKVEIHDGFTVTKLDYPKIKLLGSLILAVRFALYLIKHQHEYDCVHIHITRILAASAGLVRPFIKCVLITKISGFFEFEGGVLDEKKRKNPANALIRFALRKIDYVQTISRQTAEKLRNAGFRDEQIKFIPNGIQIDGDASAGSTRAAVSAEDRPFVIGYCGRMRTVKGVQVLIDAYARLVHEYPDLNVLLSLAGDGETEQEMWQKASDLKLGDKVEFVGFTEDTNAFLGKLDLYVQPSFAEGLPNAVIEAMNQSLAVVATDIGGNNDLVSDGENGLLFEAGDIEQLKQHLMWCLDNRDALGPMGRKGQELIASQYGFEKVSTELLQLYRPGHDSTQIKPSSKLPEEARL